MKIKTTFVALLAVASLAPMTAEARPDTRNFSCPELQSFIDRQGVVVMSTGTHTFERFVSGSQYCGQRERSYPVYVPASDGQCTINGVCQRRPFAGVRG